MIWKVWLEGIEDGRAVSGELHAGVRKVVRGKAFRPDVLDGEKIFRSGKGMPDGDTLSDVQGCKALCGNDFLITLQMNEKGPAAFRVSLQVPGVKGLISGAQRYACRWMDHALSRSRP